MKRSIELPLMQPIYSTYNNQGCVGAILNHNPSIRNWFLNKVMMLRCNRQFLYGFTSPEVSVCGSGIFENPFIDKISIPMQQIGSDIHTIIRILISAGYYVLFIGVDDYYVEGKSWYHERHFSHDGLIHGYDQSEKTYSILAYDESWIYRSFKTPQKSWDMGRKAEFKKGNYGAIYALSLKSDVIEFNPQEVCNGIKNYLDSSLDKYPLYINDLVYGIAVHDYIAMYLNKLADGSIPYERMDRRVFRQLWEHKKVMLERIIAAENALQLKHDISSSYETLVQISDTMRLLYASYHLKRRDSLLKTIQDKLIKLKQAEEILLTQMMMNMEGAIGK